MHRKFNQSAVGGSLETNSIRSIAHREEPATISLKKLMSILNTSSDSKAWLVSAVCGRATGSLESLVHTRIQLLTK